MKQKFGNQELEVGIGIGKDARRKKESGVTCIINRIS